MTFFARQWLAVLLLVVMVCAAGCAGSASESGRQRRALAASGDNGYNLQTSARTNNASANRAAAPAAPATAPIGNTAPKPKAAVYIMGNPAGRDALRMAVNTFLVKSGKYQMVAVDAIDIVAKEHQRQMGGSVSDEQIAKMGYDAGAQYVCVVERSELDGYSYVATRMISVESKVAEFADIVKMPPGGDVIEFTQWQIGSMLGLAVGPRPGAGTAAPAPTYNQRYGVPPPVGASFFCVGGVPAPFNFPSAISLRGERYNQVGSYQASKVASGGVF